MLNQIVYSVIENIEDKSMAPLIAERATGAISERGLRNRLTPKTERKVIRSVGIHQRNTLIKAGWKKDEVSEWFKRRPKTLYAGLIYDSQTSSRRYPKTLALATKVDALSARLFNAYQSGDFKRVRTLLEKASFLTSDYWQFGSSRNLKNLKVDSTSEQQIQKILETIRLNSMLSILALWDVEFSAQYFQKYQSRSIFEMVTPKVNVTPIGSVKLWYPYRRLLSLLSCLGHFIRYDAWPKALPKPGQVAITCDVSKTDMTKWRRGTKRITYRQFINIWNHFSTKDGELAQSPDPVYVTATFWDVWLNCRNPSERSLNLATAQYIKWWARHRKKYEAKGGLTGVTPWPQCFTQI